MPADHLVGRHYIYFQTELDRRTQYVNTSKSTNCLYLDNLIDNLKDLFGSVRYFVILKEIYKI